MVIVRLIVVALVFVLASEFIPGVRINGFWNGLVAAFILSLVNITIKPIVSILTLPFNILTLGLFTLVINALMICLVAAVMGSFSVTFWGAFFLAIIITIVKGILSFFGC
jgi:putative membrane protein